QDHRRLGDRLQRVRPSRRTSSAPGEHEYRRRLDLARRAVPDARRGQGRLSDRRGCQDVVRSREPVRRVGRRHERQGVLPGTLAPGVVTIAWNTPRRQVYTTFDGTTVTATPTTIWVDGTANAASYAGGYSTVVEPAPGGFIAAWAACRDTSLTYDCNSKKAAARVDLLSATSADGTLFTPPSVVASATTGRTL